MGRCAIKSLMLSNAETGDHGHSGPTFGETIRAGDAIFPAGATP